MHCFKMAPPNHLRIFCLLFKIVQISGDLKNVALFKPTYQSSTRYQGVSQRAVEGDTNNNYLRDLACSHTPEQVPGWWCVDLQQIFNINSITIYNRVDYQYRLSEFEIKISSSDLCNESGFTSATSCYINTPPTNQSVYTIDRCNQPSTTSLSARTVFINVPGALTLCEVQIFADCVGDDCLYECIENCRDGTCNKTTGNCGECKRGYFGITCFKNCNVGCSNFWCNKNTGYCIEGCKSNFTGRDCGDCVQGTYGTNCESPCNVANCIGNCNTYTGQCGTCKSGWYGTNCELPCKRGWYGTNCESTCSVSNCEGNCDKDTGKCSACNRGWFGTNCQHLCNNGCSSKCQKDTGRCTDLCRCEHCVQGRYGTDCQLVCNYGCININCSKDTGTCAEGCNLGKYSSICGSTCEVRNCIGNCDRITGECDACRSGWYGNNCESSCSLTCIGECAKSDGTCFICKSGWFGAKCASKCSTNCSGGCNKTTGICTYTECKQDMVKDGDTSPVVAGIIGAIFGIVVTVIIGVLSFFFHIKGNQLPVPLSSVNTSPATTTTPTTHANSPIELNTYDTLNHASVGQSEDINPYTNLRLQPE